MKSAITVSLVEQARGGPIVFWDGLEAAAAEAARLGFDAIEIFPPAAEALNAVEINALVKRHGIGVAAVGTGGGWLIHKLHLCLPDLTARQRAKDFIRGIIDVAAKVGAPAIIGSMQGRWGEGVAREQAIGWLGEALNDLGEHAASLGQPLLYEPLNRYETNLFNRVGDTVEFLKTLKTQNVKILADLYHMNIEEATVADALRAGAGFIGHIHFVDSNRRAVGMGHTDFAPIVAALRAIGFTGYLSAEALPLPDSDTCARSQIDGFRRQVRDFGMERASVQPESYAGAMKAAEAKSKSELRELAEELMPPLAPPEVFDPVIEAYKKDVDRTLIRENLKLTPVQRLRKLESYAASAVRLRGAAGRQPRRDSP